MSYLNLPFHQAVGVAESVLAAISFLGISEWLLF